MSMTLLQGWCHSGRLCPKCCRPLSLQSEKELQDIVRQQEEKMLQLIDRSREVTVPTSAGWGHVGLDPGMGSALLPTVLSTVPRTGQELPCGP